MTEDLAKAVALLKRMEKHKKYNKAEYFIPMKKQLAFIALSLTRRECGLLAGNRVGKSEVAAYAVATHLTGNYPKAWPGKVFDHPIKGWTAGPSSTDVRNVMQSKLCGQFGVPSAFGTGMIPKHLFADKPTLARGVTDAFDTIQVRHVSGGVSVLSFKSYEQGKDKFQGETLDLGHCDEDPGDKDIYSEFLTRILPSGLMLFTATAIKGRTPLVELYWQKPTPDRAMVEMSLDEAEQYTEEEKQKMLAAYPAHERATRRYGTPMMGSGRVFPYDEESIKEPFISRVPFEWAKLWGVDFGVMHPFAAVLIAWDKDNDVVHVLQCVRMVGEGAQSQPLFHATAVKNHGANVPVAWPHDGAAREKGGGGTVASIYKKHGLLMLPVHATFPEGGYSTEAGIREMDDRMMTGRFKVGAHCVSWFEEFREYHRDEQGLLVKVKDDALSATRIALMMKRYARPGALGSARPPRKPGGNVQGLDFDIFAT